MQSNKELFEAAFVAFVPSTDDPVDNIPFYRTWFGMKAVLAKYGLTDKEPLFNLHTLCCWAAQSGYEAKDGSWEKIVSILPHVTPKSPEKERRYYSTFYASEPALPTEKDARAIFERQYRESFPENRINSIHAKEKWEACRIKALGFAALEYDAARAEYDKKVVAHEAREAKEEAEWQAKLKTYNDAVALIQKLKEE